MRLRLYHHSDGARIAYREAGTGPPIALLHSAGLSHREWEPLVEELGDRFRLVMPDLPLHGDSEDRPRHAYTPKWLTEVLSGFIHETCGPRPVVAGHDVGAHLLLWSILAGTLHPSKLVLMPAALHRRSPRHRTMRGARVAARAAAVPGLDRAVARAIPLAFRPDAGVRMSARANPAARDLVRHAVGDLPGNAIRARSWAKAAAAWPLGPEPDLLDHYASIDVPVLLLWADEDPAHPQAIAEDALDLLPHAQLRILEQTGFLMAYDDPVGLAREIAAFAL